MTKSGTSSSAAPPSCCTDTFAPSPTSTSPSAPRLNRRRALCAPSVYIGFVPSIPLPLSMLSVLRMFDPARREVDVFPRYHISFADLWDGSERVRVGVSVARVASLAHLLRAKRINGRPHDLLDIAALLALSADGRDREGSARQSAG